MAFRNEKIRERDRKIQNSLYKRKKQFIKKCPVQKL